jgi:hypothetical protein
MVHPEAWESPSVTNRLSPQRKVSVMIPVHQKWPSIEALHNIRKAMKLRQEKYGWVPPVVTYRPKIKLHGTNAGVQLTTAGGMVPQARNSILHLDKDNMGFARWVHDNEEFFRSRSRLALDHNVVIHGEWCGKGIQKGAAITEIDHRVFAVFAIQIGYQDSDYCKLVTKPEGIYGYLGGGSSSLKTPYIPDNILVVPYMQQEFTLDWSDQLVLQSEVDKINELVLEVEREDPWVSRIFKVSGVGEGVVMYPQLDDKDHLVDRDLFSDFVFKAKGEKHQQVKQKKPVQLDPERVKNIEAFAELVVTDARLEQAVTEGCDGEFDVKKTGHLLKWIGHDVKKECKDELKAAKLDWKQVSKAVTQKARNWYIEKAKSM